MSDGFMPRSCWQNVSACPLAGIFARRRMHTFQAGRSELHVFVFRRKYHKQKDTNFRLFMEV